MFILNVYFRGEFASGFVVHISSLFINHREITAISDVGEAE